MRFAVNDGPGIRTTVFLKGCPLHCAWCHNPESISPAPELMLRPERCIACGACLSVCPQRAIEKIDGRYVTHRRLCRECGACADACPAEVRSLIGKMMTVEEVMREVEKDKIFYQSSGGGVTLSGGEPLMQPQFSSALLTACKNKKIHTAVDTSGYAPLSIVKKTNKYVDLFLFDLKILDEELHIKYTGFSLQPILTNLSWLCRNANELVVRVPLIPGINDAPDQIEKIGRFVAGKKSIKEIQLLPYHRSGADKYARLALEYTLPNLVSPGRQKMQEIASSLQKHIQTVSIGG
ncbi:glycyl-radical enzyme activating protein [candidate division KSB1 bacterium]|nr:glycyl-radical enzyme activating protein [candidate division KSB1 bacterium]